MARAVLFGTPVSPGIAIGRVRFMHKLRQDEERRITPAEVEAEQAALRLAAENVRVSLQNTMDNVPEDLAEYREVIAAQMEMARDAKLLAVPVDKLTTMYRQVVSTRDVQPIILDQIAHFFAHYKDLEPGKWVKIGGWADADVARRKVVEAIERYKTHG